jgi:hypothetical protein
MRGALRSATVLYCATVGLFGIGLLEGCTATPSIEIETRQVPVSEIVERVKCEIWLATRDRLADPYFAFLKKWDATVDLTLLINEQSGINPGVSVIDPLRSAIVAGKGTFSQSFSLGLGGGVTGQANLSDTVSFSLSLNELAYSDPGLTNSYAINRYYRNCMPLQENDLIGKLRFKEWIDQALSPVHDPSNGFQYLTPGVHPSVKKAAAVKISSAVSTADKKLQKLRPDFNLESEGAKTKSQTIDQIREKISPEQLVHDPKILDDLIKQHENDKDIVNILKELRTSVNEAKKSKSPAPPQINDPLDTISHQIQFIVTWNANATPSWTLVNIKGPAPSAGSFLSAQRQSTHQLLITMGPVKQDVAAVRSFQQFNAALQRVTNPLIPQ